MIDIVAHRPLVDTVANGLLSASLHFPETHICVRHACATAHRRLLHAWIILFRWLRAALG